MSKQIMVVDDEVTILVLVDLLLKRRGFNVVKAQDPYEALSMLESSTPDLFILDVMMPEMNGLELCRRIRARRQTAHTPVIMYTANQDERGIKHSIAAGADAYLDKAAQQELVSNVERLLGL